MPKVTITKLNDTGATGFRVTISDSKKVFEIQCPPKPEAVLVDDYAIQCVQEYYQKFNAFKTVDAQGVAKNIEVDV